jgi:hypothetical protein
MVTPVIRFRIDFAANSWVGPGKIELLKAIGSPDAAPDTWGRRLMQRAERPHCPTYASMSICGAGPVPMYHPQARADAPICGSGIHATFGATRRCVTTTNARGRDT